MRASLNFDVQRAIPAAWDILWKYNLKERKKDEAYFKKTGKRPYGWARTYYLTATSVERMVKDLASDTFNGRPWRKEPGYGECYGVRFSGNLQAMVRHWLLRTMAGQIVGHNFGRGHISGMRFRPVGEPMAETELQTMVQKEERRNNPRPRRRHFSKHYGGRALCVVEMKKKKGSHYWGRGHSQAWTTEDWTEVTCPSCLKLKTLKVEEVNG